MTDEERWTRRLAWILSILFSVIAFWFAVAWELPLLKLLVVSFFTNLSMSMVGRAMHGPRKKVE